MSAFAIPLMGKEPAPISPMQTIGGLMQMKSQMIENALRQAQTATAQQEMQLKQAEQTQKNRDLADQNTIQQFMGDPEKAPALIAGDDTPLRGKVQEKTREGFLKAAQDHIKEMAATDTVTLGNSEKGAGQIAEMVNGLKVYADDLPALNSAYQSGVKGLMSSGALHAVGLDISKIPQTITDPKQLDLFLASARAKQVAAQQALKLKEDQQKLDTSKATAAKDTAEAQKANAELPGKEAESKLSQAKLAMVQQAMANPESGAALIDSALPPMVDPDTNRSLKAAYQAQLAAGNVEGAARVVGVAAEHAAALSPAKLTAETNRAVAVAKATAPIKIQVAGAEAAARGAAANPGEEGVDMMAEKVLAGQSPGMGRNPVLMAQVYKRAGQMAKERGLTSQQAVMEGNAAHAEQSALNAVTKQYETLKPFAEMAEKNADILEQRMKDVSDFGVPFLNTPIRSLEQKFLGDAKVTAFHAAMLPVQADFARILNSPTGSGVLSDSARHEMESAISPGATVGQIKEALDVFRTDARNRKAAYEDQLRSLKERTIVRGASAEASIGAPATHRIKVGGKLYDYKGSGDTADLKNYTEVKQ